MGIDAVAGRFLADADIAAKQSGKQGGIEQYSGIRALFQRWFGDGIEVKLEGRKDAVTISSKSACEFIKRNLDKSPKFANIEFIQSNLNDIVKRAKSPEFQAVKIAIRTHGSISGKKHEMAEFVKLLKDAGLPISKEKEETWFKSADIVEISREDLDEALKKCTNVLISKLDPEIAKNIQARKELLKQAEGIENKLPELNGSIGERLDTLRNRHAEIWEVVDSSECRTTALALLGKILDTVPYLNAQTVKALRDQAKTLKAKKETRPSGEMLDRLLEIASQKAAAGPTAKQSELPAPTAKNIPKPPPPPGPNAAKSKKREASSSKSSVQQQVQKKSEPQLKSAPQATAEAQPKGEAGAGVKTLQLKGADPLSRLEDLISTKSDLIDSLKNNKIPANAKEAACTLLTAISGRTVTDSHGAELATIQIIAKIKSDKNKTREEKAILQSALQEILKKLTQK